MKKFLTSMLLALTVLMTALFIPACSEDNGKISVYMPDGAPALSMAMFMNDKNSGLFEEEVEYSIVDATTVTTYVTGENPKADVCILPVNIASLTLGTGEAYKMLGTVTHGNLFIVKKNGGENVTAENIENLKGKTVGIINLAAIPGLTFKLILNKFGIEFNQLENGGTKAEDKVNLVAVDATEVLPTNNNCDYFVVPEPALSTKIKATKGALSLAGSLQELYDGEDGYPQAVIVAKNSLIESNSAFVGKLIELFGKDSMNVSSCLKTDSITAEEVVNTIKSHLNEGMAPTFTAENLTAEVVANCAVRFEKASECKEEVNLFINKLIEISPASAKTLSDNFYYAK